MHSNLLNMKKPNFYHASDYCGIEFEGGGFYYGYEHSICTKCGKKNKNEYCNDCESADREWCFVASFTGKDEVVIPFGKLKQDDSDDMFNVLKCLLLGIGAFMSK